MSGVGGPALDPPSASEVDDERHPLHGEEVVLLLVCKVGVDGEMRDVRTADGDDCLIARLADLDHATAQAVRVLLLGEVERLTQKFHALPAWEQDRRLAGKDAR